MNEFYHDYRMKLHTLFISINTLLITFGKVLEKNNDQQSILFIFICLNLIYYFSVVMNYRSIARKRLKKKKEVKINIEYQFSIVYPIFFIDLDLYMLYRKLLCTSDNMFTHFWFVAVVLILVSFGLWKLLEYLIKTVEKN